jgi:Ca-activated chloride channel family protein
MNLCALALVLLVDVSGSISADRYALQHAGLAQALQDQQVRRLMLQQEGGMAITVIEWSDRRRTVVPWRMIQSADDVSAVAETLTGAQRTMSGSTAMGDALVDGLAALDRAPCAPQRKVIDVSGDGRNNDGDSTPDDIRPRAKRLGITINGLPIQGDEPDVADYYRGHVVTEDGFVIEAKSFDDLATAIRYKLMIEVSSR